MQCCVNGFFNTAVIILIKNKTLQIRVPENKFDELQGWAERFSIKLGPFCLFILMEKLDHLNSYEKVFNDPDHLTALIELMREGQD